MSWTPSDGTNDLKTIEGKREISQTDDKSGTCVAFMGLISCPSEFSHCAQHLKDYPAPWNKCCFHNIGGDRISTGIKMD